MPFQLDAGDRRTLLVAGGVFLLLILGTVLVAPSQGMKSDVPTTYSSGSGGAKAAYLLLAESGYRVERWEQDLSELPLRPGTTVVLAEPIGAPSAAGVRRLREFITAGGRVIVTGFYASAFVPEVSVVQRPWIVTWQRVRALSLSAQTRAASEISMVSQAYWSGGPPATMLFTDGERVVAVRYAFGKGEVIWWAAATPLTNAGLKEAGDLEFFLACLGSPGAGRVLWDEFFHGYRRSAGRTLRESPLTWIALQVTLLALTVLATFSRRSGPVLAPEGDVRLSPLEFVQTLGGLYERAGAASVAVDICHQRFRYWLTRRLGTAGNLPVEDLARALRERWRFDDADFAATLRRCEVARENPLGPKEALRLVRELYRYAAELRLFRVSRGTGSA